MIELPVEIALPLETSSPAEDESSGIVVVLAAYTAFEYVLSYCEELNSVCFFSTMLIMMEQHKRSATAIKSGCLPEELFF